MFVSQFWGYEVQDRNASKLCVWWDLSSQIAVFLLCPHRTEGWESSLEPLLGSILMVPKSPPPNAITLGVRISIQGFGEVMARGEGGTNIQPTIHMIFLQHPLIHEHPVPAWEHPVWKLQRLHKSVRKLFLEDVQPDEKTECSRPGMKAPGGVGGVDERDCKHLWFHH